jgi:gliding motility-associated protein GldC
MKKSEIKLIVNLDDKNVPLTIEWDATDKATEGPEVTKAFALSIWDHAQNNTLRMDLWGKDMSVEEMKMFVVNSIGGLGETLKTATSDSEMYDEINDCCRKLVKIIDEKTKAGKN